MADNQQRMKAIASQFGDAEKISVFLGRDKVYPGKELSNNTFERLENTLRSPETSKVTLRVLEDKELIYRSSQGEVDKDLKGIANQHHRPEASAVAASHNTQAAPVESESRPEQVSTPARAEVEQPNLQGERLESSTSQRVDAPVPSPEAQQPQTKQSIPLNPSPEQLDQKMPEIVNPTGTANAASDTALAAAQARIDSLQTQLDEAKRSIQDLSKFVHERGFKHWAQNKAQEIGKTSQSIAGQSKDRMMQWMQGKVVQVKEVAHQKVGEVKSVTHEKINEAKTLVQDKANEVKGVAHERISDVKTSAQGKVHEFKEATQLKAIGVKEAARTRVNQFLAPVNADTVEKSAKHIVQTYGNSNSYNKAATHSYHLTDKGEVSIARQSDKAVVFQNGDLTKAATPHDIQKMNALPSQLEQIKAASLQTSQKQEMEVGG